LSLLRVFVVGMCLVSPVLAQQPETQSQSSTPGPSQPSVDPSKSAGQDPDRQKPDDQIGKSKLEKETGTVNDRIFEVLPNYGTVETANTLPPLT